MVGLRPETVAGNRSQNFIVSSSNSTKSAPKYVLFQNNKEIDGGSVNIYNNRQNKLEKKADNRKFVKPTEHKFSKAHTSPDKIHLSSVKKDIQIESSAEKSE